MTAYLANFGFRNAFWPVCKSENVLTLETSERLLEFWRKKDRPGWIDWATQNERMINGQRAITPVASRWYNLLTIFHETENDIWFHRETEYLFWTQSLNGVVTYTTVPNPENSKRTSILLKRPTTPWKNEAKDGRKLLWRSLHPKAHHFLQTEMTYQEIANDRQYRDYALSLVAGPPFEDLHQQKDWTEALGKNTAVKSFSNLEITIYDAIRRLKATVKQADGRSIEKTTKIKLLLVPEDTLREFLEKLYRDQEGLCALTGLKMLLNNEIGSNDFRFSIDRIDSDGHYELNNIQLVCRFANYWKSNSNNIRFKELIGIIKSNQ